MSAMKPSLLIPVLLLTFYGCGKDDHSEPQTPAPVQPVDFRDALTGNYVGTKHNYSWIMGAPPSVYDTTFAYSFTIVKDTADSSILADGNAFKLDSALKYYEMPYPGQIKSFEFRNDTAILFFRSGGLGGYYTTTITGVRQ